MKNMVYFQKSQRPSTAKYSWDIHGRRHLAVKVSLTVIINFILMWMKLYVLQMMHYVATLNIHQSLSCFIIPRIQSMGVLGVYCFQVVRHSVML